MSIIYGRNGSGKTSIAKAIRQLVGKDSKPQEGEVAVPYIVTSDAVIPEEKKPSVFIFDEEFVQENVRTKGNGLETIVMMGEQVDLDTQITAKKAEGTVVDSKVVEQTALKEKYENTNDTSSPQYFFNKIRDELRKDGGWADTDRDIKGNTVKSRVTGVCAKWSIYASLTTETGVLTPHSRRVNTPAVKSKHSAGVK